VRTAVNAEVPPCKRLPLGGRRVVVQAVERDEGPDCGVISTRVDAQLGTGQLIGGPGKRVASVVVCRLGRPDPFPDRSAHGRRAVVSVGSSGSSVGGRIIGTRDEYGILFVSCLVVLSCHLAPLVPARPRYSGHSCLSWPRLGRARTCLIVCGRAMCLTGTVGAATRPTPTGGSGIPARWCDSRLSLSTSTGTHGSSTPTRTRRTCLGRPAVMGESTRGAGGETRDPGLPRPRVGRSE